jgi:hypothetical protein
MKNKISRSIEGSATEIRNIYLNESAFRSKSIIMEDSLKGFILERKK